MLRSTCLALLLAAALAGCSSSTDLAAGQTPASSAPTSVSRAPGSLVVAQEGSLLRLDPQGTSPVRLTSGFADSQPAFQPGGQRLAFSRGSLDGQGARDLFSMAPDGSALTNLTGSFAPDAVDPSYSWDGQRLVFGGRVGNQDYDLFLMQADGSAIRPLTSGPEPDRHPAFSPDGQTVVFQRGDRICQISTETGQVTDLTQGSHPSYCPPGDMVIFSRGGELWVREQGQERLLTSTAVNEFDPQHAPQHDLIYSLGAEGPREEGDVYAMKPDGSQLQRLTQGLRASELTVAATNQWTAYAPYPSSNNPFSHSAGICYGHFNGRSGTVSADLQLLVQTEGFRMLHIYNAFSNTNLDFDPDMQAVLNYAVAQSPRLEILLGTLNSLVSQNLQSQAGAASYVARLKPYLDAGVIKAIALGNEPNDKTQANLDPGTWGTAATNLRAALSAAGHADLPITGCLLFGGLTSYPPAQATFQDSPSAWSMQGYMQAISQVNSKPFVFVNILPSFTVNDVVGSNPGLASWYPAFGLFQSTVNPATNDGNLAPYWDLADLQFNCVLTALRQAQLSNVQVYISESGWPSSAGGTYATPSNEAAYINGLLNLWIRQAGVPVFLFEAFDEPTQGGNSAWGIHDVNGQLKPGIQLPSWLSQ